MNTSLLFSETLWLAVLRGVQITVLLTVLSVGLGLVFGTGIALLRVYGGPVARAFAAAYVFLFRGIPLLILLFFLYYGAPQVGVLRHGIAWVILSSAFATAVLAFTLNNAAYLAEAIRGGIATVKPGEIEAGHALGLSRTRVLTRIVLPLAFRNSLSQIGNETIFTIKASAIASVVTVRDLLGEAQHVANLYSDNLTPLLAAAAVYVVLVQAVELAIRLIRRALNAPSGPSHERSIPHA